MDAKEIKSKQSQKSFFMGSRMTLYRGPERGAPGNRWSKEKIILDHVRMGTGAKADRKTTTTRMASEKIWAWVTLFG